MMILIALAALALSVNGLNNLRTTIVLPNSSRASIALLATLSTSGGDTKLSATTFNIAKSVVGSGVLTLSGGLAFVTDKPVTLFKFNFLSMLFAAMAAYTFQMIGDLCGEFKATSFKQAWAKTVGEKTKDVPTIMITTKCFFSALAYTIVLGDTFSKLALTAGLPVVLADRNNIIVMLMSLVIYPLCSLPSLNALAPFSLAGLGGTLYIAAFMVFRLLDKSYDFGGKYFIDLATKPSFGMKSGGLFAPQTLVWLSMIGTAYIAHYNSPIFYANLKDNTRQRWGASVYGAFAASFAVNAVIMSAGFLTFGGSTAANVLNNYSGADSLATIARICVGVSLVTGYPLLFVALRDGLSDLLGRKSAKDVKAITAVTLTAITALSLTVRDVGFILGLAGASMAVPIMFIVPPLMKIAALKNRNKAANAQYARTDAADADESDLVAAESVAASVGKVGILGACMSRWQTAADYGLMVLGALMSVVGVYVTLARQAGTL